MAILGAALVLALGTIMSGLSDSFGNEARRTVGLVDADTWVVASGAPGPFTTATFIDDSSLAAIWATSEVTEAEPILVTRQAVTTTGSPVFSSLIGVEVGKLGAPVPASGTPLTKPGEVIVDVRLHAAGRFHGHHLGTAVHGGRHRAFVDVRRLTERVRRYRRSPPARAWRRTTRLGRARSRQPHHRPRGPQDDDCGRGGR